MNCPASPMLIQGKQTIKQRSRRLSDHVLFSIDRIAEEIKVVPAKSKK